jgi:NAD(P)-dependent dehydrogenase (short-subunit alcohol dehydrogenase family)
MHVPLAQVLVYTTTMEPDTHAPSLETFPPDGVALVVGASGGIGAAMADALAASGRFAYVVRLHRGSDPPVDLTCEGSIAAAVATSLQNGTLRLAIDATGFLHDARFAPEKSLRELDAAHLAHAFAINATGPALLMKHLLPHLPRQGKSAFVTLSARVGSIGDNRLGGWHAYRASKAALNQLVRTASIELARRAPQALCVAVHPGTVDTALSAPFAKTGLTVQTPREAAARILRVLDALTASESGGFFDWRGDRVPW